MAQAIRKHATERSDTVAVTDERGSRTWAELNERTNRLVNALRTADVGIGDVFAMMIDNSTAYFELMLAAGHSGSALVPVNWHWTADELAYVLGDSGAKALVVDERFLDVALDAVDRIGAPPCTLVARGDTLPEGWIAYESLVASGDPTEPDGQRMGGPMFYTSGTTGFPKGVARRGEPPDIAILELMGAGFSGGLGVATDALAFLNGPGYHSAQWAFSFLPLVGGASVVSRPRFDAAETLEVIRSHGVTHTHLVPTQMIRLLRLPDDVRARFDASSLVEVWHGAAPCPPDVKRQMIDWWGPVITEYYGGTEGGVLTMVTAEKWLAKPGTVGGTMPMAEVRILDDDGHDVPAGTAGQIWFKSATSDFEYHNAPEKTAAAQRDGGWATLGDIGYFDDDGDLFLSDRKIDMIISGGVNIYPAEIEGCLAAHPIVADAAVFGIPDEEFGEKVKAAVELVPGAEPSDGLADELIAHVRSKLAGYKAPRSIDFHEGLPRHPTGKLYKRLLRDPYWEDRATSI
jgi:long-chain acyl-CoA synthetase